MVLDKLNGFRINHDFCHCRELGQVKVRFVANRPEEGFISANPMPVSSIRLQS